MIYATLDIKLCPQNKKFTYKKNFHWLLSASSVCHPSDVIGDIVRDDGNKTDPAPPHPTPNPTPNRPLASLHYLRNSYVRAILTV